MEKQITTGLRKAPLLVLLLFFAIQSQAYKVPAPVAAFKADKEDFPSDSYPIRTWKTDTPGISGPKQIIVPGGRVALRPLLGHG